MLLRSATLLLLLGTALAVHAQAQLLPLGAQDRGGGTLEGCNPSLVVDFESNILGGLEYRFDPVVELGDNLPISSIWSHLTTSFGQTWQEILFLQYPLPGEYPVCLTVNAFDLLAQEPCSTTTCKLIDIVQDSLCLSLEVDFTLGALAGQAVDLVNLTTYAGGAVQYSWDFGDGAVQSAPDPSHVFVGNGPHRICLTATDLAPPFCSRTACKWLYFGPGGVDCDVLVEQGFLLVQQENLVGVLDTSLTSGMDNAITWDFGDGAQAQGRVAVHAYTAPGWYDLCSTLSLWGPLLADTCQRTLCATVEYQPAVGVHEAAAGALLHAWPVPVQDRLHVAGIGGEAQLLLVDGIGRTLQRTWVSGNGVVHLDMAALPAGAYLLRVVQDGRQRSLRVLKQH